MKARLPYIHKFTDRHGRVRLYYRRGKARVALPDPAESWAEFLDAYKRAERGQPKQPREAGTIAALIASYKGSVQYKALKPSSRETYDYALAFLLSRPSASAHVAAVKRRHIIDLRNEISDTPGKANVVLRVLKVLFAHAIEMELVEANPALRIKPIKAVAYRSWTDAELLAFEAMWPLGSPQRLVYALALYTGQRRGDVAKMTWADITDGTVAVVQEKTGEKVWIPLHSTLKAELAVTAKRHAVIVSTAKGRAFTADYLGTWFAQAIEAAGLPEDCVMHGLRKASTRTLAEAGCTDAEIMSITGHRSRDMVTLYTRDANKRVLAGAAIKRLEDRKKGA